MVGGGSGWSWSSSALLSPIFFFVVSSVAKIKIIKKQERREG